MENIEVWIVMNSSGEYELGPDRDSAVDNFENNIGGAAGCRITKLNVAMTPPEETEVDVTVPDTAGELVASAD